MECPCCERDVEHLIRSCPDDDYTCEDCYRLCDQFDGLPDGRESCRRKMIGTPDWREER